MSCLTHQCPWPTHEPEHFGTDVKGDISSNYARIWQQLLFKQIMQNSFFENLTAEMDSTSKITKGMTVSSMIIQFVN